MYAHRTGLASIAPRMSGKTNTNTNNNNNTKVTSAVLPSKYSPHKVRYEKPRGHSGHSAETSLPTFSHPNPPPSYTLPQCSRSGTSERVLAQPPGTPRERRRHGMGQNTERSGRQSPNTLSRSYSSDQIYRKYDQQYHFTGNDPQKQSNSVVTSRERAVTKPVHKENEKAKPQVARESRSRERDRTPSSVRRSQSLNRTSPRDSWKDNTVHTVIPSSPKSNRHATTASIRPYDQSPSSSGTLTGNRTSSERHRLPSDSSSYSKRNVTTASNSTPPVVTTSYSTPSPVTTSYSTSSAVTTPSYTTPSTVSKNKVNETGELFV